MYVYERSEVRAARAGKSSGQGRAGKGRSYLCGEAVA
jgi:hypothetical protein